MQKLTLLDINPNILVSSNILMFDKPDLIYIPIKKDADILVHKNDYVNIGTPIIKCSDKIINTTISGKVNSIKKINTINGNVDAIEILNDYQEKMLIEASAKRNLNKIKKENFDNILISNFDIDLKNKKNLVLNSIDDEPYVLTENFNLFLYYEGFLELLDKISKVYKLEKVIITIKSTSSQNINKLMSNLGMYPNISIEVVPDFYLLGHNDFILKHLNLSDIDSLVIRASFFYNIYNLVKRNRLITDKIITISGDGIDNPSIVKVKIGSMLKDVIDHLIKVQNDVIYIVNGLMQGKIIDIKNFVITDDVNSILIMKQKKNTNIEKCINCGACIDICPVNINPLLLKKKKYKNKVIDRCLKCGLCSYICPVNINFNEDIRGGLNE